MVDFKQERALAKNRIRRRGIYLLPNLFTTAALFAGFYAIVQAMNGRFDQSAVAIFVAMVLDGLDGRVARFNTMLEVADKRYFQGLPSPSAAALVAGFVWIIDDYAIDPETVRWAAWAVTLFAGLTMVSNLKYYSFKTINLRRSVPFAVVILIVLFIVLISYQPSVVPFACVVVYAISGFIWSGWLALKRRRG